MFVIPENHKRLLNVMFLNLKQCTTSFSELTVQKTIIITVTILAKQKCKTYVKTADWGELKLGKIETAT